LDGLRNAHIGKKQERRLERFACGNSVASSGVIVLQDKEYIAAPARDTIISLLVNKRDSEDKRTNKDDKVS
jgi:hypothetical protein